jgi:hypothetical protein
MAWPSKALADLKLDGMSKRLYASTIFGAHDREQVVCAIDRQQVLVSEKRLALQFLLYAAIKKFERNRTNGGLKAREEMRTEF